MKLRNITAAVWLAFSGSAFAQSAVTLYGVADMNVEYVNHVGVVPTAANQFSRGPSNDVYRMNSGGVSGSRWGLRGNEDLGNGLKLSGAGSGLHRSRGDAGGAVLRNDDAMAAEDIGRTQQRPAAKRR